MTIPYGGNGYGGYGGGYGYGSRGGYYNSGPYYNNGGYYSSNDYNGDGSYAQAPSQAQGQAAQVEVMVPDPNAEVFFNGQRTMETGQRRVFTTVPLEPGYKYSYDIRATWMQNGQRMSRDQTVQLQPGGHSVVDFGKQGGSTSAQRSQTQPAFGDTEQQSLEDQPRTPSPQQRAIDGNQPPSTQQPSSQQPARQQRPSSQQPGSQPQQPAPPIP
jgi:uncharacterized protein (TIGR03000 family)